MPSARPVAALALIGVGLALAACQPEPESTPTATPSASETAPGRPSGSPVPSTEPETTPEPSVPGPSESAAPPAPAPSPPADAGGLPVDCAHAYSAQMQDWLYAEFGHLNPPDASRYPSSKVADLLDVIHGTPNLTCFWTPPGDRALNSNAAIIRPQHVALVRDVLAANFPGCDDTGPQLTCSRQGEQIQGAVEIEHVVLRGDLLVTTLALNADAALVDEAVDDMLAHLPG
ncbi:hypothetical protein [Microbacterium sp. NPDC096154]|uniref:hypothetical protein n=1 Tax=Microbacterium sp. NPDC096154 TaxID=3155549 RepID=UPI003316963C